VARRRGLGPLLAGVLAVLPQVAVAVGPPAVAPSPPPEAGSGWRLVDRVVAVVDEDPILLSDIERVIGLGMVERSAGEGDEALRRRVLDQLIEGRLRLHEIGRYGFEQVPLEEVDRQVAALAARFSDRAAFTAELTRLGLDENALRQLVARQLAVLAYVEERLGPRVFVGVEDIRRYYDEELTPQLAARGGKPPPIDEVREQIRGVLRERRLNDEIDRWTAELRARADVVDLLDAPQRPLPPAILTLPPGR
jgi:peptidyl-prolyl cis-trans isomerase SurA